MIRVASIGECMIELRHRSATTLDLAYGGDTLNTAVYLARLTGDRDVRVDYVSALGDDAYSDGMLAMWRDERIGVDLVARLPGRLPGLHTIRTDARGERSFTYWRSASAARDMLRGERAEQVAAALAGYDLLYLSGITLSILDPPQRAALVALADAVRAHGGRVAFDGNYRPVGWPDPDAARAAFDQMLERVDIALPTLDDEQALFGVKDARESAERLHRRGVAEVAIKLGAEGLLPVLGSSSPARSRPNRWTSWSTAPRPATASMPAISRRACSAPIRRARPASATGSPRASSAIPARSSRPRRWRTSGSSDRRASPPVRARGAATSRRCCARTPGRRARRRSTGPRSPGARGQCAARSAGRPAC